MAESLSTLMTEARQLSSRQFLNKYPHAWLISDIAKSLQLPVARSDGPTPSTDTMAQGGMRFLATKPSTLAFHARPQSFLLFPIAKADRNVLEDRVLLGRSMNNDIVIADSSVSKAHAYFNRKGSSTRVVALPTLNPTKLNGVVLSPNGAAAEIAEGATLEFGFAGCRFIGSAALYKLLTA